MAKNNTLAHRTIHTRAFPNPNPPETVDNPEKILKRTPVSRRATISSSIHRANSAPEDLAALLDPFFDLDLQKKLPRTRSFSVSSQPDTRDSEIPPPTPPDLHFLQNLGLPHPRSAQQTSAGPTIPAIHIPAAQAHPLPQQNIIMVAWYALLVLPQPLVPLPNDYQSNIPHFTAKESTTTNTM